MSLGGFSLNYSFMYCFGIDGIFLKEENPATQQQKISEMHHTNTQIESPLLSESF